MVSNIKSSSISSVEHASTVPLLQRDFLSKSLLVYHMSFNFKWISRYGLEIM